MDNGGKGQFRLTERYLADCSHTDTDCNADTKYHANPHHDSADAEPDADTACYADTDCYADSDCYSYTDYNADTQCDADGDSLSDAGVPGPVFRRLHRGRLLGYRRLPAIHRPLGDQGYHPRLLR